MAGYSSLITLARADNTAGASAQIQTSKFDPENLLIVYCSITGYSAAAIFRLQFNGDTGTTAYAYSVSENNGAASTGISGAAAGINSAVTTGVGRALIKFEITNISGDVHGIAISGSSGSLVAGTAPVTVTGSGIWTNTAQINQITMDVGSGGGTMNAGTRIWVLGVRS